MNSKKSPHNSASGIHLLIIDDEEAVCKGYEFQLKTFADFRAIISITDPEEALLYLEEEGESGVDVVLLDMKMAPLDGLQVLSRIKDISEAIQVIVVSAFVGNKNESLIKTLKEIGVADIVAKPVGDFDALTAKIKAAAERKNKIIQALAGNE